MWVYVRDHSNLPSQLTCSYTITSESGKKLATYTTPNCRHKKRRRTDDNTAAEEEEQDNDDNDDEDGVSIDDDGNESAFLSPSQAPTTLLRVPLSTDLAARGLDIVDVTHIYHLGFIFTFTQHITLSKPHDF